MGNIHFKNLNKEQLDAIQHTKGPLLILAGAGTGKTTVITERVKYLILNSLAKPSEILALTFTEKAAGEMEERIDRSLPFGYIDLWVLTFHSFCENVLRQEALEIGLNPDYKLLSEAERIQFVKERIDNFNLDYFRGLVNPTKFLSELLQHFSRLQDEDIDPKTYLDFAIKKQRLAKTEEEILEAKKTLELARAFQTYEELKEKEGIMDFGDLIVKTLKLFRQRPNVLKKYKERFKYILVDEFQDTNFSQNQLAILLAGKGRNANITVCGDDDQSIYRFRGAAVSNIIYFRKTYPEAKVIVLTKNYRSSQLILDKAYELIKHNNPDRLEVVEGVEKKLVSKRKVNGEIKFFHLKRGEEEADLVAKKIIFLVKEEKEYKYQDIAILVRANNHADSFIRSLSRYGIPFRFLGVSKLFKQPEVIDLISYLKVLYDPYDSTAFFRLLSIEEFGIKPHELALLGSITKRKNKSLFELLENLDSLNLSSKTKGVIEKIYLIIKKHLSKIRKETAGQLLYYFLEETGLLTKLLNPDTPYAQKKAKNISLFFDRLKAYENTHEDATVFSVVDWLEISAEIGESPLLTPEELGAEDAVNILTIHSAKGLEFPVVFLVNLVNERFPSRDRKEKIPIPDELVKEILPQGDYHLQEERRLFYVGMTRAKDKLFFTAASFYGDEKRERKVSPFIFEALGDSSLFFEKTTPSKQLSLLDYTKKEEGLTPFPFHLDYISYSQIEAFRICPLHYKLKYILNIPTPPSPAANLGSSVHLTLRDLYLFSLQGKDIGQKFLEKIFKKNWIGDGYATKKEEKKAFNRGLEMVLGYFENFYDPQRKPYALEKVFRFPLRDQSGDKYVLVGGKFDRVDDLGDALEIVDYKTGENYMDEKEAAKDLQLTIYALAALKIKERPFSRKPEEVLLTFYFLDKGKKVTIQKTKEELKKAEEEIFSWKEKIENSDFKCSRGRICQDGCEYSIFCKEELG